MTTAPKTPAEWVREIEKGRMSVPEAITAAMQQAREEGAREERALILKRLEDWEFTTTDVDHLIADIRARGAR